MVTHQEEYAALLEEFQSFQLEEESQLNQEEFQNFLDVKLGRKFDQDITTQLFEQMYNQTVSDAINILIRAKQILQNKIQEVNAILEKNRKLLNDTTVFYDEQCVREKINIYNIMEGSILSVNIMEATNLRFPDFSYTKNPFVVIKLASQQFQTPNGQGASPQWSNTYKFDIETGREDLLISICDYDKVTVNVVIGRINIPLSNNSIGLKDQKMHDLWLDLYERNGNKTEGKIHVQLQWIYSKVQQSQFFYFQSKFLKDVLKQYEKEINDQENELQDYENNLKSIFEPFKKWQELFKMKIIISKQKEVKKKEKIADIKPAEEDSLLERISLFKIIKIIFVLWVLLSLIICLMKAQFFDIIIFCDFYILYHYNSVTITRLKAIVILIAGSLLLDLIWLIKYSKNWFHMPSDTIDQELSVEGPIRSTIVSLVFLLMVLKLCQSVLLLVVSQQLNQLQQPVQSVKHSLYQYDIHGDKSQLNKSKVYLIEGNPYIVE